MMMAGMTKRYYAMAAVLAMALVAFAGMIVADVEPELTTPTLTVVDTFEPTGDGNAYTIVDSFTFTVPGYGAGYNNSNITTWIMIGAGTDYIPMDWDETIMGWTYEFMPESDGLVGVHDVHVKCFDTNNDTNENMSAVTQITVWHPVLVDGSFTLGAFDEDTTLIWNVSDAFKPEIDVTGAGLEFGVGPEGFPAGWTFTPMMEGEYTHWHVTPPADFSGTQMVNVTAMDTNGVGPGMNYMMFTLTVNPVNDAPMIEGIMVGETLLEPEMYNYTWTEGENTTMWDHREVINLSLMEDEELEFMVKAMDIDMDELDYAYMMYMETDPYEVMLTEYLNETNVTYTVPYNFTLVPDMNANGMFWGMMNVSDATHWDVVWIIVEVEAVNDAPTATEDWDMTYDLETEEEINLTLSNIADIDGDDVTVMWYIDGTMVADWNEVYFRYSWDEEGTYNVSAKITDGTETVDVGYFLATVELSNTAPSIALVQAIPVGMDALEVISFLIDGEVEEGKDVEITCTVVDLDGDALTYEWTNDVDTAWKQTTTTNKLTVSADDLEVDKSYTFTCKVTDGNGGEDTATSNTIKIVEKSEGPDIGMFVIIAIAVIAVIAILLILFFVLKGGKKEEEETPPMTEEPAESEEMPSEEGYEGETPMPEEQSMDGELPVEEPPMEGEVPMEEPLKEEVPMETEEVPAPEA